MDKTTNSNPAGLRIPMNRIFNILLLHVREWSSIFFKSNFPHMVRREKQKNPWAVYHHNVLTAFFLKSPLGQINVAGLSYNSETFWT